MDYTKLDVVRYEEFLKDITEEFVDNSIIEPEAFPDMDLYVDQIVNFINSQLKIYSRGDKPILTKTMVSNYVKHGMLPAPVKKKYDKEQMIMLELILCLKNTFHMDDIKRLMEPFIENRESTFEDNIDFYEIYEKLEPIYKEKRESISEDIQGDVDTVKNAIRDSGINDDDTTEIFLVLMILALRVDTAMFIAKSLLRDYYVTDDEKETEKLEKKKLKEEKELAKKEKKQAKKEKEQAKKEKEQAKKEKEDKRKVQKKGSESKKK